MTGAAQLAVDTQGGELQTLAGETYSVLVSSGETDGRYTLFQWITPPGSAAPPHTHARYEETFFIIDGEVEFTLGEEEITALPGTWVRAPVGTRHAYRNTAGADPARMLVTFTPGGIESLFAVLSTSSSAQQSMTIDETLITEYFTTARDVHGTLYEVG